MKLTDAMEAALARHVEDAKHLLSASASLASMRDLSRAIEGAIALAVRAAIDRDLETCRVANDAAHRAAKATTDCVDQILAVLTAEMTKGSVPS